MNDLHMHDMNAYDLYWLLLTGEISTDFPWAPWLPSKVPKGCDWILPGCFGSKNTKNIAKSEVGDSRGRPVASILICDSRPRIRCPTGLKFGWSSTRKWHCLSKIFPISACRRPSQMAGQRGKAPAKAWAAALYEGWFDMDGLQRNVGAVFDPKPLPFCAASALLGRPFRRSQGAMGARTHTHTVNIQDLSTCPSKFGYATIIIYDPYPHEWLWCRGKHVTYNKPVGLKYCKLLFFLGPQEVGEVDNVTIDVGHRNILAPLQISLYVLYCAIWFNIHLRRSCRIMVYHGIPRIVMDYLWKPSSPRGKNVSGCWGDFQKPAQTHANCDHQVCFYQITKFSKQMQTASNSNAAGPGWSKQRGDSKRQYEIDYIG